MPRDHFDGSEFPLMETGDWSLEFGMQNAKFKVQSVFLHADNADSTDLGLARK